MIMKFELTRDELNAMSEITKLVAESAMGLREDGEIRLQVKKLKPLLQRVGFNTTIPFMNSKVEIVENHDVEWQGKIRDVMYEKMTAGIEAKH